MWNFYHTVWVTFMKLNCFDASLCHVKWCSNYLVINWFWLIESINIGQYTCIFGVWNEYIYIVYGCFDVCFLCWQVYLFFLVQSKLTQLCEIYCFRVVCFGQVYIYVCVCVYTHICVFIYIHSCHTDNWELYFDLNESKHSSCEQCWLQLVKIWWT